ncbi:hypothetical protein E1264_20380 [Actinomadura sp. KC216]|uniref:hypothetical protein n=1 Tax=Actinomadura sp. KC216 TaxID=2530370 RepID=UPI0010453B65|nr:hypothetical protein [Actinomadura sp. KC216]TDB85668.1 hypothetical protein E1264_20380 [Actinomadura sp. KC216]
MVRVAVLAALALLVSFPVPVVVVTGAGAVGVALAAGRRTVRELRGSWWLVAVRRPGQLAAGTGGAA